VGRSGIDYIYSTGLDFALTADASKEACCNSCAADPSCGASAFNFGCYHGGAESGMCTAAGQHSIEALSDLGFPVDEGYFVSNGNCGVFNQA
jgi:hypothetical protein